MPTNFVNPHPLKVGVLAHGCASVVGVLQRPKMHLCIAQGVAQDSSGEVHLGGGFNGVQFLAFH